MIKQEMLVKTIKLDDQVHKRLAKYGTIGMTFQDVIVNLMDFYDKRKAGSYWDGSWDEVGMKDEQFHVVEDEDEDETTTTPPAESKGEVKSND